MTRLIHSISFFVSTVAALADSPAMPTPRVTVSKGGQCIFKQIPAQRNSEWAVTNNAFGIAYRLETDGTFRELWRIEEGWYAFSTFLSDDARYLVRMGNWAVGQEPSARNLAVAFYDKGKLLAEYSTADLVRHKTKVARSVSHYTWLAHEVEGFRNDATKPEPRPDLDWANKFHLKTCDGISYVFDATTGKIVTATRNGIPLLPLPSETQTAK